LKLSSPFPLLHTVRAAFTAYSVPSIYKNRLKPFPPHSLQMYHR
jgi:hypothetical protein